MLASAHLSQIAATFDLEESKHRWNVLPPHTSALVPFRLSHHALMNSNDERIFSRWIDQMEQSEVDES